MQGQSEAPHAFAKYLYDTTRVVLTLKTTDAIVTRAHQGRFALKPWCHLGFTPPVEHVVQLEIPHQRREHRALDGTQLWLQ